MTDRQAAALRILGAQHGMNANRLGFMLRREGHIKKSILGCGNLVLPASSILRSLGDLVDSYRHGHDQWAEARWFLTKKGRATLDQMRESNG